MPLRGADDDLDRLAGAINRMLDRIEALMESHRQVSTDIAHDLANTTDTAASEA